MKIINNIIDLKKELKTSGKTLGFIPTMGALHDGHISLIKQARDENELVVVSIFVNPTQFLEGEDLDKYPRRNDADIKICQLSKVDYLFMPDITTMYGDDEVLIKAPKINGFILEGFKRPGHFDGMLQVVLKLFNIVNPTKAYFGKKDAQQLTLIKQMVKNFYLDIKIIECPIVRESDGLALSSRNIYLDSLQRELALNLSRSLKLAAKAIGSGQRDCSAIIAQIETILNIDGINLEYIKIVNREFKEIKNIEIQNSIILVAVQIGTTRLIDNIWL